MKAEEKCAHELTDAEWRDVQDKIRRGARILGDPPARRELPDARYMTDAEFEQAISNINMVRAVK